MDERKKPQVAPGRFRLGIQRNFFAERVVRNRMPRTFGSPFPEVFPKDVCGTWGHGLEVNLALLTVGLHDRKDLFQP